MILYTFWVSHFSEKARWALDRMQVAYREKLLTPGPHMWTTRRLVRGTSVPLLLHAGHVVHGSSDIVDYVEDFLLPRELGKPCERPKDEQERVADRALERELDAALGVTTQRLLYAAARNEPEFWRELWSLGAAPWVRSFYRFSFPLLTQRVHEMYRSRDPNAVAQARDTLARTADRLDTMLRKRPYLAGDGPGRADYAAAAFLAPAAEAAEHPCPWPTPPSGVREIFAPLQDRPLIEHVRRMYREHRRAG